MNGHMALYKAVLHNEKNTIPKWFQETLSSYVSIIKKCEYSFKNHLQNACYLINNKDKCDIIRIALEKRTPYQEFDNKELALLNYAEKLIETPGKMNKQDFQKLKEEVIEDGEILEANQIICYFNYVNRSINGLGVTTEVDIVGYYEK
jgi:uncharacterized peroxidase-related enzyme